MLITITKEYIAGGEPKDRTGCPMAVVINRAMKDLIRCCSVYETHVVLHYKDGADVPVPLPKDASDWIRRMDAVQIDPKKPMARPDILPLSFDLPVLPR